MPYESNSSISLEPTPHPIEPTYPIHIYLYDALTYMEFRYRDVRDIPRNLAHLSEGKNMWIEITTTNMTRIRDTLNYFDVHPFVIDDTRISEERMKLLILEDDIYLLLDLIHLNEIKHIIEQQKIRLYLQKRTLITIQEYRTPALFSEIKYRLQKKSMQSKGRLKQMKIDYLFYCILNVIIEHYMDLLESILHETERIDKELMYPDNATVSTLNVDMLKLMFYIKHELLHFKIVCAPLKDILIKLQKTRETVVPKRQRPAMRQCRRRLKRRRAVVHNNFSCPMWKINSVGGEDDDEYMPDNGVLALNDYIYKYLKRLHDHAVRLNDTIDSYSDIITSLIDFYIILNGELINNTMHTLTIMSCIFMPLNFFSSLSSMNHYYMFQIPLRYGYFLQLGLMGLIGLIMIIGFKLKRLF